MIFSRIGRSLSRSSRVKNLLYGDARLGTLSGIPRANVYSDNAEKGLGFLRGFVSSAIARSNNGFASNLHASKSIAANPMLHRMFSSEAKEESKSNTKDQGTQRNASAFLNQAIDNASAFIDQTLDKAKRNTEAFLDQAIDTAEAAGIDPGALLLWIVLIVSIFVGLYLQQQQQKISFHEFKNMLLEQGLVDHIDVDQNSILNKSVARIYVNSPLPAKENGGKYKYFFNIGSVESFEEKLEEAQEALGIDPHDFVPVSYTYETVWHEELTRFSPSLLFLVGLVSWYCVRKAPKRRSNM